MALVKIKDKPGLQPISHDKAVRLWAVLNAETEGTPEQQAYAVNVERLYMDMDTAPVSYQVYYRDVLRSLEGKG